MIIYPAVDIKDGVCVRLEQGQKEKQTVYAKNPVAIAREWERQGAEWIHVVDLDGAFAGVPRNREVIGEMARELNVPLQLGGGIRDLSTARNYLELGVRRVIVGTRALTDYSFIEELLAEFNADQIVLGLDARDGLIAIKGWEEITTTPALELAKNIQSLGVKRAIYTDIARDGMLRGPNFKALQEMASQSGMAIIASGGVSTVEDIRRLADISGVEGAIVGKALYEGRLTLGKAIAAGKS